MKSGIDVNICGWDCFGYWLWRTSCVTGNDARKQEERATIRLRELGDTSLLILAQLAAIEFKGEMSTNSQHELPQLEKKESPVEVPGHFFHYEIGRTF
jgi:hypothetical protein